MIIEFNTVYGQVPEKLINDTRKQIISIIHIDKKIRRVEVTLKEDKTFISAENKLCSIKLLLDGYNLVIHIKRENFESAIREAIKELKKKVKQRAILQKNTAVVA